MTGATTLGTRGDSRQRHHRIGRFPANGFSLTDSRSLNVSGSDPSSLGFTDITSGTGNLALDVTGDLSFAASVSAAGHVLTITATGAIVENTGGLLSAGTLNGSSGGSTTWVKHNDAEEEEGTVTYC